MIFRMILKAFFVKDLKSSVRFNSLKFLNQERNEKVSFSKILTIKENLGHFCMSHFINPLKDDKSVEQQYERTFVSI